MGFEKVLDDIKREGKLEGKREIAKRMIDLEIDSTLIAAATGFTPEEVEELRNRLP
ncbi:hypothetical protein IDH44_12860 [Paenibacillus sp. IB182496]|uniref:Uncharacterized protein n=1 Tax=Paenibacillus sabuli TaxID=2772509 RepID=A0A927BSQ5_9BACL|nr:hypothetical protein [Paenibacillus sabuli]MBD2846088.1 hypothetical protein [Paenibacillus sabuli]